LFPNIHHHRSLQCRLIQRVTHSSNKRPTTIASDHMVLVLMTKLFEENKIDVNKRASPRDFFSRQSFRKSIRTYCLPILIFSLTSLFWESILLYTIQHTPRSYYMTREYAENNQIYGLPISGYKFLKYGTSVEGAEALGCEYNILVTY